MNRSSKETLGAICGTRVSGFTLVEIIIVVLVLGILAAVVLPHVSYGSVTQAQEATIKTTINAVNGQLAQYRVNNGGLPATIDPNWFVGGDVDHPQNKIGLPDVQVYSFTNATHPGFKVLKSGVLGAYWYNPLNGSFRARVTDQGSAAATLDLYNRVNSSNETALGNYGGGAYL